MKKTSKYVFGQEIQMYERKTISKVGSEQGNLIPDSKHILKETQLFYENLFLSTYAGHEINVTAFINTTESLSQLTSNDSDKCEGNITLQECYDSLKLLQNNKSPGCDGLSVEFHKYFWDDIGQNLFPL